MPVRAISRRPFKITGIKSGTDNHCSGGQEINFPRRSLKGKMFPRFYQGSFDKDFAFSQSVGEAVLGP